MSKKQSIIRGTFILTITGFLSRFMGFFYRIFLSRVFGEEGVGLYQLIFPVYALCIALSIAGIETAISRTVARKRALGLEQEAKEILSAGLLFTLLLSCLCTITVQKNAFFIANVLLGDARCQTMLIILSYTFPFCAVHSCICGYCYGLRETKIPAVSQLVEQTARILSVYIFFFFLTRNGQEVDISIAVCGLVIGELFAAAYAFQMMPVVTPTIRHPVKALHTLRQRLVELLQLSVPLTANRVLINLLQSIEAVSIPGRLEAYRYTTAEALSIYGVLNGMALPCILFPSAITSSVSIMLMPTIAEIQAAENVPELLKIIKKVCGICFILGLFCCFGFLIFGPWIGMTLFGSQTAGKFIVTLAWICPFLYTNSAFLSIINGLGKTGSTFLINTVGLLIRIAGVFGAIPVLGVQGYLWGLLISQLAVSLLSGISIFKNLRD